MHQRSRAVEVGPHRRVSNVRSYAILLTLNQESLHAPSDIAAATVIADRSSLDDGQSSANPEKAARTKPVRTTSSRTGRSRGRKQRLHLGLAAGCVRRVAGPNLPRRARRAEAAEKLGRGYNGIWGSLGERATVPTAENAQLPPRRGSQRQGRLKRGHSGTSSFEGSGGPHKVKISPFDPDRHVWVVNDSMHQIYKFTNDGKQLVADAWRSAASRAKTKHISARRRTLRFCRTARS